MPALPGLQSSLAKMATLVVKPADAAICFSLSTGRVRVDCLQLGFMAWAFGFQGPDDDPSGHPGLPLQALGLWGVSPSMSFSLLPSCTLLFQCSDGPLQMQRGPGVASWGRRAGGRWSKRRHVSYHQPAPHREPPPLPTTPAGLAPPPSSWVTPDGSASIHETSETVPLRRWL